MNILMLAQNNKHIAQGISCVKKDAGAVDIFFKGIISKYVGISAQDLREAFIEAAGADVFLHVNSPGGEVFEAREMQSIIAAYEGKVTAVITGVAASAATIVSLSCSEVQIMAGSRFMIHNAMTIAFGNKSDMKKTYDLLESFDIELADEYSAKTKQDATLIAQWMNDETWFTAEKALEAGFVDKVNSNKQEPQAFKQWDLTAYSKAPAAQADEPLPEPAEPTPPIEPETKETEPAPELAENNLTNQTKVRQKQKLALLALH